MQAAIGYLRVSTRERATQTFGFEQPLGVTRARAFVKGISYGLCQA